MNTMTTILILPLLLFITCPLSTANSSSTYLLSGIADTSQLYSFRDARDSIRRHLACFRNEVYQASFGRDSCCSQLYLKGFIKKQQVKYCLDRLAAVPKIEQFGGVSPAYYLALDLSTLDDSYQSNQIVLSDKSYRQYRYLQVVEDKEKESLFDGYKGVEAFSPFHLTGYMPNGLEYDDNNKHSLFPLLGIAEGSLSNDGGMHRKFGQTVHLSFQRSSNNIDARYRAEVNVTVLLPITENVFIDADDPFVQYGNGSQDDIKCKTGITLSGAIELDQAKLENKCDIQFISSEVIDIEQPSFASQQYVAVYHISITLGLDSAHNGGADWFDLDIDYATNLHIRYPSLLLNETQRLAPIVIQQPVLYSANADIQCISAECSRNVFKYVLQTNVASVETDMDKKWDIPHPIAINFAAGVQADYWWVTFITMTAAIVGGFVVITNMDSISQWH